MRVRVVTAIDETLTVGGTIAVSEAMFSELRKFIFKDDRKEGNKL